MRWKRYKITVEDEGRLELIKVFRMTTPLLVFLITGTILLFLLIASLLIAFTPLQNLIPRSLRNSDRATTMECVMRVDSISMAYQREKAFLDNFLSVLNTDRKASDSTELIANPHPMTTDSLLGPSVAELRFRAAMEDRVKYNISVLTPLAAEGMLFTSPGEGAVISAKSKNSAIAEIIIPRSTPVNSIAEGTVLDVHYDAAGNGYTVLIQHPRGFVSRYRRLANPLIDVGDHVDAGQIISLQDIPAGTQNSIITLELWRDGDVMIPSQLLY